ncbi:vanadium-dependent haloperoxidase [Halobellus ruber]|uniref:Vanadium-dependent haloperoxidase n=1 Tax=Halobellus ruber TaxID=2761102 RepID=A0A7J9SLS5_9EURY|nr:vanadium-dependent haloperoxidase [Halobellus ruber]MBB6647482.1 vanadium-dependent haloperoxidase [Halobellus ruber]
MLGIGTRRSVAATTHSGKSRTADSNQNQGDASGQDAGQSSSAQRRKRAAQRRREAVRETLQRRPLFEQPTNDDDSTYDSSVNYFASYSKGLPHDDNGEPDAGAYEALRSALSEADGGDFDAIPQAGVRPLTNPEAAISYNMVGLDPNDIYAPAAPSFDSAQAAGEMVELYWMALLRDVPFSAYADDDDVAAAAAELAGLSDFDGPTDAGAVFRGTIQGVQTGPYVSQFLYKDFERGVVRRTQRFRPLEPTEYMIDYDDWLAVQNGEVPQGGINRTTPGEPSLSDAGIRQDAERYPITGRDLATYVGENVSQQPYMNAALILQNTEPDDDSPENLALANLSADGPGSVPADPGLPVDPNVPDGFVDFVRSGYQSLLGGILQAHAHAAWYHKWRVNRRPRPEEFGGRVYHVVNGTEVDGQPAADRYPIHGDLIDSDALNETRDRISTSLLPQAYPDGSPTHPSYPGGHAVTAGSNATILKAYFDGDAVITNPVRPDPEDPTRLTTDGVADRLTVRGEINKLATNVSYARSWAGIHYRSDTTAGLRVGERIAAAVLSERLRQRSAGAYGSRGEFTFTTFDGTEVTVSADGVSPAGAFDPPLFRSKG